MAQFCVIKSRHLSRSHDYDCVNLNTVCSAQFTLLTLINLLGCLKRNTLWWLETKGQKGHRMWGCSIIKVSSVASASHHGGFPLTHMEPPYLIYRPNDCSHRWTPSACYQGMWGCSGGGNGVQGMVWQSWDCWAISTQSFQCHLEESPGTWSGSWEWWSPKSIQGNMTANPRKC